LKENDSALLSKPHSIRHCGLDPQSHEN